MPSASAETDAKMLALFGPQDGVIAADDWIMRAICLLENAGYVQCKAGWVPKPGVSREADMTPDERTCLIYLFEEWDFGGLTNAE